MATASPSVTTEKQDGQEYQVLREPATGSEVWTIPSVGVNTVSFRSEVEGQSLEIIRFPESFEAFVGRPTYWGAATLFPFPGRIRDGKFRFAGREYQLPLNENNRTAIHGCVAREAWTFVSSSADENGAAVTYRIGMDTHPHLNECYPFPFRLTLTLHLKNGRLHHHYLAENLGDRPMPIGLGLHPYFPLPFGTTGSVDDCEIWIDAPFFWEQDQGFPVGAPRPASESLDLRTPRSLRALASVGIGGANKILNLLHSQFSGRQGPAPAPGGIRAGVRNPHARREAVVEADAAFPACVSFIPAPRDKVSFEPHTCTPNAFNLTDEGLVSGTITLGPREFWRGSIQIYARAIDI
jgi:aldose 1-epimerase